ncbi:MAG: hypoxanthine phosphoribosyltransferase [Microthrixaceae bacterium]|nr:hypoxanthine phosphoribosyltransferase [Microthrixaceae bacterium]
MSSFRAGDGGIGKILVTREQLEARVVELGTTITADYSGRAPLLVCILRGAYVFLTDLARAIDLPVEIDFMAVSSYGSSSRTSGTVRLVKDLDQDIEGRDVILVEDIIDTGLTLRYLRRSLEARRPASLEVATLLARDTADVERLRVKYVGFEIGSDFVIGYGLDLDQRYRNLAMIACYDPAGDPFTSAQ